jgi:hypothetical protein
MESPPPVVQYILAAIMLGLGGYMLMRSHGPNPWIGVRLPWTLADREIWDKSWVLAAWLLVAVGLGALVSWPLFLLAIFALLVLCMYYPFSLYRRKYGTWRYWRDIGWLDYRPAARCPQCGQIQKLMDAGELAGAHCEACGAPLAH